MAPTRSGLPGLPRQLKERLIAESLRRRVQQAVSGAPRSEAHGAQPIVGSEPASTSEDWAQLPGYRQLQIMRWGAERLGIENPFFREHEGVAGATTVIAGRAYTSFSNYNYLGLSGHPAVSAAAKQAIDRYGTSVSASRLVAGERPIHRQLERALAGVYGVDDCVVFVSGHATNVSTIGYLFGPNDLVLHDALIHNSALQGIGLAGARRMAFAHNDAAALDALLLQHRRRHARVLIVLEGLYSMDGDVPDLPRFIDIKRRHRALLMVDEAHSFGVLGERGLGIREHCGVSASDVDIWMGTLSKSLASCGGFIAGAAALVEHLKCAAPGFVFSVGMAPPVAAAALAALGLLQAEPQRVQRLRERARLFLELARVARVDTGSSAGLAVIPAITASSIKAARLSQALLARGVEVQPIVYPAVAERAARLRFFVNCEHSEEQIRSTVQALGAELECR